MVTRKSGKPAGRGVDDEEVKSAYHDEVLYWLIDSAKSVVGDRWGLRDSELETEVASARKGALEWLTKVAKELNGFATGATPFRTMLGKGRQLSAAQKAAVLQASTELAKHTEKIRGYSFPNGIGDARLIDFEVMKPVCKVEERPTSADKRVDAGYVDMAVKMFVPKSIRLQIKGLPRANESWARNISDFDSPADIVAIANKFSGGNLSHEVLGSELWMWMSVRTGSFTLGEVLQELKNLRQLESRNHGVALVVDGIDEIMAAHVEREGFVVVNREDYRS